MSGLNPTGEGCITIRCRCSARVTFVGRTVEILCGSCNTLLRAPGADRSYLMRFFDERRREFYNIRVFIVL